MSFTEMIFNNAVNLKTKSEIIGFWRKNGLLDNIKSGSVHEWRCAKSYNNLAIYLYENKDTIGEVTAIAASFMVYAIIRRLICDAGKKITRIIEGKELFECYSRIKTSEILEYALNKKMGDKNRYRLECFKRMLEEENLYSMTFLEFNDYTFTEEGVLKMSKYNNVLQMDFLAILCCFSIVPLREMLRANTSPRKKEA